MKKKHHHGNFKDLTGQVFGWLIVEKEAGRTKWGNVLWFCKCSCGNPCTVSAKHLRTGKVKSCGCFHKEKSTERIVTLNTTHGYARHGINRSATYRAWTSMKSRAENHDGVHNSYTDVKVCKRWMQSFEKFISDVGERPSPKHSLGRILDMGNYEPRNVFWMTMQEQKLAQRNKRALLKWAAQRDSTATAKLAA